LATAHQRLSVILVAIDVISGCSMSATTATGRVVQGAITVQRMLNEFSESPMWAIKD